ncbi:MAG: SAM-dependent methyltransferase, partial [Thermoanaerobaculia bacterium]|nr:SAM-dependent methyltransferase [Thermoanaerobaculia bacterium]
MRATLPLVLAVLVAATAASAVAQEPAAAEPPAAHDGHHRSEGMHHDFSDVERFERMFEDPERVRWQQPEKLVAALEIAAGMTVADLGAGTGYFLPWLNAAVGPKGRVLALDVEPAMV